MKRHDFLPSRLVFGAIFVVIALGWLVFWDTQSISLNLLAFIGPLLLIGVGVIGLLSTLGRGSRGKATDQTQE